MFERARVRGSIAAALGISCAVLILPGLAATHAHAQTLTSLYSFQTNNTGIFPSGGLTAVGSTLYGTTLAGGPNDDGTVFSIATSGGNITTLATFNGSNGHFPQAGLLVVGSTLYGTTSDGGNLSLNNGSGDGVVFSVPVSGGSPTVLCAFSGSNGVNTQAGLTLVGSTLYGTTLFGGTYGWGTVFSIATSGGSPTTLCSSPASDGPSSGGLILVGSRLYGTTSGGADNDGTVFSIPTGSGTRTVLCSFSGSNGDQPNAGLTLVGNTLYGTTTEGGANSDGVVFSVPVSGGSPTVLCSFSGTNGSDSTAGLTLIGSTLYGTTRQGGTKGDGTVFSIATSGGSPTVVCSFTGANGWDPVAGLTLVGNTLYGATDDGGAASLGNVFALALPTSTLAWAHAGGGSWNLAGNWDGNQVPGGSTADTVTFGNVIGSNSVAVTLSGNWAAGSLTFNTSGGGSYTISRSAGDTTSTLMLSGSVTNSGGNHTIAAPVVLGSNVMVSTTAGTSLTISGPISESAVGSSVTLAGSGRVILSASNTYTGGTAVQSGILVAANGSNGSATGSGIVTLNAGTLASDPSAGGSIAGEVVPGSAASVIAPGGVGSIGKLTLGSLITASNLALDFDLTTPGGSGDLLTITNALTLNPGTATTFGTNPTAPGDYRLIGYGSLTGGLGDLVLPSGPYSLSTSVDPGYIDLVVVPEPSTLALFVVGTIGLAGWAWRRRLRAVLRAFPLPTNLRSAPGQGGSEAAGRGRGALTGIIHGPNRRRIVTRSISEDGVTRSLSDDGRDA
jgi:uncharacterized repeat protein (TIGR03803 family)/autotransporter-associated beta strand protein